MLASIRPGFLVFLGVGVAMLVWNRRLSEAMIASHKAFTDTLGFRPLQRWSHFTMRPRIVRTYLVVFALIWLAISAAGFLGY